MGLCVSKDELSSGPCRPDPALLLTTLPSGPGRDSLAVSPEHFMALPPERRHLPLQTQPKHSDGQGNTV